MKIAKENLKKILKSLNPVEMNSTDFLINCPECGYREAGISFAEDGHIWGCFRKKKCGKTGNIFTLKKYGIYFSDEEKITLDFKKRTIKVFGEEEEKLFLHNIQMPLGYKRIQQNNYLDSRRFTARDYEYWEVGRTSLGKMKDYVIFPVKINGENKGYIGRAFKEDTKPKYRNSISDFSKLLGGSDKFKNSETVILVEGLFDVININRLLDTYSQTNFMPVCSFGAKISIEQIDILKKKKVKKVILLFDPDVIKVIKKVSFQLSSHFETRVAIFKNDKIDAGNCNIEELSEAIENLYSPLEFNLEKIDRKFL